MRFFLEIRTQRIFNNSTKLNQKLGSNSVLNQPIAVSSVLSSASKVHVQRTESRVQGSESSNQGLVPRVQRSGSSIQRQASIVQCPASRGQCLALVSRVQEFRMSTLLVSLDIKLIKIQ